MPNVPPANPTVIPGTPMQFSTPRSIPNRYVITGITKDSTGATLGNCYLEVFETVSTIYRGSATSDANGNYTIEVNGLPAGLTFFIVAYKTGSPDVAGTTVNTLYGT